MALTKRKDGSTDVWWIDVMSPDGKRIRETTKTGNKALALKYHDKRKRELFDEHKLGIKVDRSFDAAAEAFLKDRRDRKSVRSYELLLDWWKLKLEGKNVREVTQELIIELIESKRDEGVSEATCNRYLATLRATLRLVWKKYKWLSEVPNFFLYIEDNERERWITPEEIARLLGALPLYLRGPCRFALATGLRRSNVLNLRWDQIDMVSKTATFDRKLMKGKRTLTLPLTDEAMAVITEQIGNHYTYVFVNDGNHIPAISHRLWWQCLAQAGLDDLHWHDLRHTWATNLVRSGVKQAEVQLLGGWETESMVRRYAHHDSESLRDSANHADVAIKAAMTHFRHTPHLRAVA